MCIFSRHYQKVLKDMKPRETIPDTLRCLTMPCEQGSYYDRTEGGGNPITVRNRRVRFVIGKYRGAVELGYVSISGEICCYCADGIMLHEEAIQQGRS